MRRTDLVLNGVHVAAGFVLDPATVGEGDARRRVLDRWKAGSQLFELPDGQWLFLPGVSEEVAASAAPGSLVAQAGEGFSAAASPTIDGERFEWWSAGELRGIEISALRTIDPAGWIGLSCEVGVARAVGMVVPSAPTVETVPPPPDPDLRKQAGVGQRSVRADRFVRDVRAARQRSARGARGGGGTGRTQRGGDRFARLLLRSPLGNEVSRRHARYIEELSAQFQRGAFDEALRHAISLGGDASDVLGLRLPQRRERLDYSSARASGGRSVPWGASVRSHLLEVYRQAAVDLEAAGRIDEAAFVLVELLAAPVEGVLLLERHERYTEAATLAENRDVGAAIAVRLWWKAGDRERALRLARRHRCHAIVIDKLAEADPEAAHGFRLHWVDELERSGDVIGAIDAGWPDPAIRPLLANLVDRGIELGGDRVLSLRVRRVLMSPTAEHREALWSALRNPDRTLAAVREALLVLGEHTADDPVVDRELVTQTLRSSIGLVPLNADGAVNRAQNLLRRRADPVLVADLPRGRFIVPSSGTVIVPSMQAGVAPVLDIVALDDRSALLALGELGCRIVTTDGRTKASWNVPCHRLVPADHLGSVLLLTERGAVLDVHVLDVATRRVRPYGPVRTPIHATTFDGHTWPVIDERGLAYLDLLAERPSASWRELEPRWSCLALQRTAQSMAAVVSVPTDGPDGSKLELWRWDLPTRMLRVRHTIRFPPRTAHALHLLADASSLWRTDSPDGPGVVTLGPGGSDHFVDRSSSFSGEIRVSGDLVGVRSDDGRISLTDGFGGDAIVEAVLEGEQWGIRSHGDRAALWDSDGRFAVVDLEARRVEIAQRMTL